VTVPLVRLNPAIPSLLSVGPPSRDTRPVGVAVPDEGFTVAVKPTDCPWVIVVGVTLVNVVVDGRRVTVFHFVTRVFASTEPSPVARS